MKVRMRASTVEYFGCAGPEWRMMPEEASPSRDDPEVAQLLLVHRITPGPGTKQEGMKTSEGPAVAFEYYDNQILRPRPTKICIVVMHSTAELRCIQCPVNPMT